MQATLVIPSQPAPPTNTTMCNTMMGMCVMDTDRADSHSTTHHSVGRPTFHTSLSTIIAIDLTPSHYPPSHPAPLHLSHNS